MVRHDFHVDTKALKRYTDLNEWFSVEDHDMEIKKPPIRLNIYLDDPQLREGVKIAAARRGLTLSAYCVLALRQSLSQDGLMPHPPETQSAAAQALDSYRQKLGPLGISVTDLISEGRRR